MPSKCSTPITYSSKMRSNDSHKQALAKSANDVRRREILLTNRGDRSKEQMHNRRLPIRRPIGTPQATESRSPTESTRHFGTRPLKEQIARAPVGMSYQSGAAGPGHEGACHYGCAHGPARGVMQRRRLCCTPPLGCKLQQDTATHYIWPANWCGAHDTAPPGSPHKMSNEACHALWRTSACAPLPTLSSHKRRQGAIQSQSGYRETRPPTDSHRHAPPWRRCRACA